MTSVVLKRRRPIADNSRWSIYFDHIVDQRGNEVRDYLVIEGKRPCEGPAGVGILAVLGDRFVLLPSYRHALGEVIWELPRGFIDESETPPQAALRELTEETGLRCSAEHLVDLGYYVPEPGTMRVRAALFVATQCEGMPAAPDDELGLEGLRLVDRAAMAEMVAAGEIEDAGTLIAYYRYSAWQLRQREEKNAGC